MTAKPGRTTTRSTASALVQRRRTVVRRPVGANARGLDLLTGPVLTPTRQRVTGTEPQEHVLGSALPAYVLSQVPQAVLEAGRPIHVTGARGLDELAAGPSGGRFDWRRPSFEITADEVVCRVVPGLAYAEQYAHVVATALLVSGMSTDHPGVTWTSPTDYDSRGFVARTLPHLPHADVVVLGDVESLDLEDADRPAEQEWTTVPGWGWRLTHEGGTQVLVLGCEFSLWGDLAGQLVRELLGRGVTDWLLLVGTAGAMAPRDVRGGVLATGTESTFRGTEEVRWEGRLTGHLRAAATTDGRVRAGARHATVPSLVQVTKAWSAAVRPDLVDPVIGHVGRAAAEAGASFDYLQPVTGHLSPGHLAAPHTDRVALTRLATELLRSGLGSL